MLEFEPDTISQKEGSLVRRQTNEDLGAFDAPNDLFLLEAVEIDGRVPACTDANLFCVVARLDIDLKLLVEVGGKNYSLPLRLNESLLGYRVDDCRIR